MCEPVGLYSWEGGGGGGGRVHGGSFPSAIERDYFQRNCIWEGGLYFRSLQDVISGWRETHISYKAHVRVATILQIKKKSEKILKG